MSGRRRPGGDDWAELRSSLSDLIARFGLEDIDVNAAPAVTLVGTGSCRDRFAVRAGKMTVGRSPMAAISLEQECVSRVHATLELDDGALAVRLQDHGSSNGTFVNGARVSEATLEDGDVVHFGPDARFLLAVVPTRTQAPEPSEGAVVDGEPDTAPEEVVVRRTVAPPPRTVTEPSIKVVAAPSATDEMAAVEQERRQLALLFQISLRYLETAGSESVTDVLFGFLDRVATFDSAFVASRASGTLLVQVHPRGARLSKAEYEALVSGGDPDAAVTFEDEEHALETSGLSIRSHALLPLGPGEFLGLASEQAHRYGDDLEFLSLLTQVHRAAMRGAAAAERS